MTKHKKTKCQRFSTDAPEYMEYLSALIRYKQACKAYKVAEIKYKDAAQPLIRLKFYEAKETYKAECAAYYEARRAYALKLAMLQYEHSNSLSGNSGSEAASATPCDEAAEAAEAAAFAVEAMDIDATSVSLSMRALIGAARTEAQAKQDREYWESHKDAVESVKQQFLHPSNASVASADATDEIDFTAGDFDPL